MATCWFSLGLQPSAMLYGLSHTSAYAAQHGTLPIALLRDRGGRRKHQSRRSENFSDSAHVKSANKGAGRSHRSAYARPPFVSRLPSKQFLQKRENSAGIRPLP